MRGKNDRERRDCAFVGDDAAGLAVFKRLDMSLLKYKTPAARNIFGQRVKIFQRMKLGLVQLRGSR